MRTHFISSLVLLADVWLRDHSSQQEGEREGCGESPLGPPEQLGPELLLAHTAATGGAPPHDHLVGRWAGWLAGGLARSMRV